MKGLGCGGRKALLFGVAVIVLGVGPAALSGRNSVVECLLPKQDVVGSNPIARSTSSSFSASGHRFCRV